MLSSPECLCSCPAPGTSVTERRSMWWDWKSHDGSAEDSVGNSLVHNSKGRLSVSVQHIRRTEFSFTGMFGQLVPLG